MLTKDYNNSILKKWPNKHEKHNQYITKLRIKTNFICTLSFKQAIAFLVSTSIVLSEYYVHATVNSVLYIN